MKKFKRILVKISGEALSDGGRGINEEKVFAVAKQLRQIAESGVQTAVVVGGGNFWRGRTGENMDRVTADQIGMLATVMNALALGDALTQLGAKNKVFTALTIDRVANSHNVTEERRLLENGYTVVFGGGTGSPFFSTDTAAVLRACEVGAEAVFCAKAVDGVYDSDPTKNPHAKRFDEISVDEVIAKNLKALDITAMAMCREYGVSMVCFSKDEPNGIMRILNGERLGTIVKA